VIAILTVLQEHGIRIHLDDFGTGFSSLSYLSQLPADAVKIDRSFVSRMVEDMRSELMVGAIIDLAHRLEKSVIAEGIETEAQAESLRALGCELGQGYYFGRPMGKDAATEWLAART
jgi:EAL domain-containing protein (putative c-di-GMP-specific phosphodiesterase class I)